MGAHHHVAVPQGVRRAAAQGRRQAAAAAKLRDDGAARRGGRREIEAARRGDGVRVRGRSGDVGYAGQGQDPRVQ